MAGGEAEAKITPSFVADTVNFFQVYMVKLDKGRHSWTTEKARIEAKIVTLDLSSAFC